MTKGWRRSKWIGQGVDSVEEGINFKEEEQTEGNGVKLTEGRRFSNRSLEEKKKIWRKIRAMLFRADIVVQKDKRRFFFVYWKEEFRIMRNKELRSEY